MKGRGNVWNRIRGIAANPSLAVCCGLLFGFIQLAVLDVRAETAYYTLDNVVLDALTQMTGIFSWTYEPGNFENGDGQFISLFIPNSAHNQDDLIATIEPSQIEITFDGNVHGDGVDIKLVLEPELMLNSTSLIKTNTTESKYSIGGDGFYDGYFLSGSIAPTNATLSMSADPSGFVLSWEPDLPGHVLQEAPSLSTNWMDSASGSTNPVMVPATAPAMFYRLKNP